MSARIRVAIAVVTVDLGRYRHSESHSPFDCAADCERDREPLLARRLRLFLHDRLNRPNGRLHPIRLIRLLDPPLPQCHSIERPIGRGDRWCRRDLRPISSMLRTVFTPLWGFGTTDSTPRPTRDRNFPT